MKRQVRETNREISTLLADRETVNTRLNTVFHDEHDGLCFEGRGGQFRCVFCCWVTGALVDVDTITGKFQDRSQRIEHARSWQAAQKKEETKRGRMACPDKRGRPKNTSCSPSSFRGKVDDGNRRSRPGEANNALTTQKPHRSTARRPTKRTPTERASKTTSKAQVSVHFRAPQAAGERQEVSTRSADGDNTVVERRVTARTHGNER